MTIGTLNAAGDIFLHSPVQFNQDLLEQLKDLNGASGAVKMIICPNLQHWLFVQEWSEAFPAAEIWIPEPALGEDVAHKISPLPVRVMKVIVKTYYFANIFLAKKIRRNLKVSRASFVPEIRQLVSIYLEVF